MTDEQDEAVARDAMTLRAAVAAWRRADQLYELAVNAGTGEAQLPILRLTTRGDNQQAVQLEIDAETWDNESREKLCELLCEQTGKIWLQELNTLAAAAETILQRYE